MQYAGAAPGFSGGLKKLGVRRARRVGIARLAVLELVAAAVFAACGEGGGSAAGLVLPPPAIGTISGIVTDSSNAQPLPDVEVTATDRPTGGAALAAAATDAAGRYRLTVPAGACFLRFSRDDCVPSAGTFVSLAPGGAVTIDKAIYRVPSGGPTALDPADVARLLATNACPGCALYGADLAGAGLGGADLSGANLAAASLRGANLAGANLIATSLAGADLSLVDLSGAVLRQADLSGAVLREANLTGADLTYWVNLTGADLSGAVLTGADLSPGSQYLSGAILTGAVLTGADLGGAIMPDGKICLEPSIGVCR